MTSKTWMPAALAGVITLIALAPGLGLAQEPQGGPGPAACPCREGGPGPGGRMAGRGGGPGGMMGAHGGMMGDAGLHGIWRLELTEAQRTQLTRIETDFRRDNWGTIGKLMDARTNLRQVETAPQPDAKKVGAAYAEVSKLEQSLLEARVQAGNQARALLTPEQQKQLEQPGPGGAHEHGRRGRR